MKILIVEDTEDSRNLLVKQLGAYGHEVTATANGVEALEQALAQPPDIIVSDILMPEMDGFQLCRECKQSKQLQNIPFVFYTATYTLDEDKKFALSLGANAFLIKPTEPDILVQILIEIVEKAKSGLLPPPEVAPLEPSLFLTEYNKRVVAKLDKKVAQLEESEKKLKYIGSVLRAIRDINQLMVRERDRAKLLSSACEILIRVREYKFAWIGLIEEGHKKVLPVAKAGVEDGYLNSLRITWDDTETGEGPTGTAIKMKQPSIMKNIPEDSRYEPWREEALKRGYRSSAVIPLVHDKKVYGALNVYSAQRDGFNDEETQLLVEVSSDLAFALKAIDNEEKRKQAEATLRESEEKYHAIFAQARDGIVLIDSETGRIVDCNPEFESLTGRQLEQLKKMKIWQVRPPEKIESAEKIFLEIIKKGIGDSSEFEFQKPDGKIVPVEFAAKRITIQGRDYLQSIARDITERRRAEERLRESEQKYRTIVDNALVGVYRTNLKGDILYMNDTMVSMLGFDSAEEMMAGGAVIRYKNKRDRAILIEELKKRGKVSNFDVELLTKTREIKNVTLNVVLEGDTLSGMLLDITEHKQADEKIKHAAEEWRTTFDSITDLVSICSKDFKLIRVNKAFANAFKMKPQEVIGKLCYTLVHGTNEPMPNCPYEETIKTGKPATAEFFEPHLGIHLEVSTSPIFNDKGEVMACVEVARDITERKRMEEQLIVTDRLASIGELAAGIAHELNNPLTSVIGFAQLLLEKDVPDDVKEDVKVIYSEAQRAAQVVKGLLAFARKHASVKQLVNINSAIEKVLELRAYEQRLSNIQVNTRFAPDLPEIMADYFQLQQAFLNIVINAEHFMIEAHNRGTLTITTERARDIIKVSFTDDGPGISKENLGHLFDPFFTTKETGKGTGLGLSICHGTITEHGGRIYAESKLGKGATFVVELPITINKEGTVE